MGKFAFVRKGGQAGSPENAGERDHLKTGPAAPLRYAAREAMTKTTTTAAAASEKQFEVGLADLLAVG